MSDTGGFYDDTETDEDDLWFLPGPPELDEDPTAPPWQTDRQQARSLTDWQRAESLNARRLAEVAAVFAAVDERVSWFDRRVIRRLAIEEISELSWVSGHRLSAHKIALHEVLRLSMTGDDSVALEHAAWAVRRLTAGGDPTENPSEFLGRTGLDVATEQGVTSAPALDEWASTMRELDVLHPLTRACAAVYYGRLAGMVEGERLIELAVLTETLAAQMGRGNMSFVPLAGGDARAFTRGGPADEVLPLWLSAIENACLRVLMRLDQMRDWLQRATKATQGLSGRTPPALLDHLIALPALSADMVAGLVGVSNMTARRNLDTFSKLGLIRELTGQERYRFWTADLSASGSGFIASG